MIIEPSPVEQEVDSDDEDAVEGEDLLSRLQRVMARKGHLCEPEFPTKVGCKMLVELFWHCNTIYF